jgi:hypothetical protein
LTILEQNLYTIAGKCLCSVRCQILLLTSNIFVTVTCSVGPVAIIACILLYRRMHRTSEHIKDEEILQAAIVFPTADMSSSHSSYSSQLPKTVHPEIHAVLKKSKYQGVKFDDKTGTWYVEGTQRMFVNEQEAAQQAYYQNSFRLPDSYKQPMFLRPPPGLGKPNPANALPQEEPEEYYVPDIEEQQQEIVPEETPDEKLTRRKAQLVAFYFYWDSEKPDIVGHVDNLFNRHDFKYIVRAVKTKYGLTPPGWEEELTSEE